MKRTLLGMILTSTLLLAAGDPTHPQLHELKAYHSYFDLAKSGDVDAQTMLGEMYLDGINGVAVDHEKAFYWLSKAAAKNDRQAQYLLGFMYENGLYVVRNMKRAVKWYKKAATGGNILAQYNLALIYKEGKEGVGKNIHEAFKWLRMVEHAEDAVERTAMK